MGGTDVTTVPIAEGLFTWPADPPALLGSECRACSYLTFPAQAGCPRCGSADTAARPLKRRGTVWTWTSQEFRPPSPPYAGPGDAQHFDRYYVGFVELPGELRVEARFEGFDAGPPAIGDAVELVVVPFTENADGDTVVSYAFVPAKEAAHD
jgi:uncharacterized OB-fold protein